MASETVILVEIGVTSPAGAASVLRFSDRAIRPFPPTDPDRPNVRFDSRIQESPALRRQLFEDLASLQPSIGVGSLTLANGDRALDAYEGHAWNEITLLRWVQGTPFSAAKVILRGLCAVPAYPRSSGQAKRVVVGLYDYRAELSKPVQSTVYAGTNGTGGVLYEGAPDGLKGAPKPIAYGNLLDAQIPAPQVNAGVRAYQLHDGPIQGSEQVFDRGFAPAFGDDGDFSGAAFDGANPAAAKYRTDVGRGLLKINGAPVGQVTFGFKGDAPGGAYVETPGPVLARLLAKAGVPAERIGASVAALASAAVVGVWAGEPIDAEQLVAFVATSAPAAVLPDRHGVWQASLFGPPKAVADFVLPAHQVIDISADEAPLPVGEVRVGWGRIWATFAGTALAPELKGTTSEARLAAEYRYATAESPVTKARRQGAWRSLEIVTALRFEAPAQALASALRDQFALRPDGKPRRQWRMTVPVDLALERALGETVRIAIPEQGIDDRFLLIGEEPLRPRRDQAIWTVWG